ncbi:acyl-CoA desaturase [Actinosynnema pretiosum subsp. pretiosum]|uniref:Stearoyl-CoA 9-desaturase n=2 Tax=Actinosynnema TaxID=40566 RepID=C6WJJ1_ACTMD|nr:acyl-CoA desaturase [Actinosynnema mirum]ACU34623.1 Stearoyl-CoA 9-desaturase [Actinosynnema mirum DSM 43827]AXX27985.1 stearoyl-CoA 9-desaturase [Actinosynnema pretiosum subsp. pretiosum]QUF07603.1 acyl-CoA desaturase [Actinosynnema pretiosum subsp. pretiosum]
MTSTVESKSTSSPPAKGPKPLVEGQRGNAEQFGVYVFVLVPFLALFAAIPVAWGWGLGWVDVALFAAFYCIAGLGITVGYHRYFTHGSFKANRALKIALAIMGSMALQGPVIVWVADHRRHHAFSDREGDPHSPWLFGSGPIALAKGFWHAHMGWLFERDKTNASRFAPDLLADDDLVKVDRLFWLWTTISVLAPGVLGGLITMSWSGALTAFFWAGLVRVAFLHHVTWSVNSICHMIGDRPFTARDKSANFWPLAILSFGESWHNLHHADPTCARHGVKRGQIDISARIIWAFEKFGWATNVRWPNAQRLTRISAKDKPKGEKEKQAA